MIFVGPSGCGKTTLMKMINRLIEPTSGRIFIQGEDVTGVNPDQLRRRIGYVIQQIGLFPHMTIGDNIATVPKMLGWDKTRIDKRIDELLELVGLEAKTFRNRYPKQLSGGQRQRVGVARALAVDPPVMLMDEPFGAIDPITRDRLQNEFLRLQAEIRKTIVFVTHDIDEAIKMGDRIAILREGAKIAQYDTPKHILSAPGRCLRGRLRGRRRLAQAAQPHPRERRRAEPVADGHPRHRPGRGALGPAAVGQGLPAHPRRPEPTVPLGDRPRHRPGGRPPRGGGPRAGRHRRARGHPPGTSST